MMRNILIGLLGAGVVAVGGYAASTSLESDPARTVSLPSATNDTIDTAGGVTTDEAGDISGPCDEAEHRNDPRCTGVTVPPAAGTGTIGGTTTDEAGDISGPCDEAEHRNDPRCTGATTDEDNSGPGSGDDDRDDDDNSGPGSGDDDGEDRSGSNSGKG